MATKNEDYNDVIEKLKNSEVNIEEREEEVPISPIVKQEQSEDNSEPKSEDNPEPKSEDSSAPIASNSYEEKKETSVPKQEGPYPWRGIFDQVGEENYATEESLFKDVSSKEKLAIWQVYNSKVSEVDENEHFKFYNNRAYIVLNIEPKDTNILAVYHNVHIWISKHCSREDYLLAVVRAHQLSKLLDEKPFIHREIQLHETDAFHNHAKILEVRRYNENPSLRLLQFHVEETAHRVNEKKGGIKGSSKRLKKRWMVERKLLRGNLTSDDVFVLTNFGNFEIFQWNGSKSNEDEQQAASEFVNEESTKFHQIFNRRIAKVTVKELSSDKDHRIYDLFPNSGTKKKTRKSSIKGNEHSKTKPKTKKLYPLLDGKGNFMKPDLDDKRLITTCKSSLSSKHVYVLDTDYHVYVWVGNEWADSQGEQPLVVFFEAADRYLSEAYQSKGNDEDVLKFHQPMNKPITIVSEDDHCIAFDTALRH